MNDPAVKPILDVFADRPKWRNLLNRFEEVLKINIWLMDAMGQVLISPWQEEGKMRFGGQFLDSTFGSINDEKIGLLALFEQKEGHLEASNPFDFRLLAIPLHVPETKNSLHIVIGPVILGAKWSDEKYSNLNNQLKLAGEDFLPDLHAVPVLSEPDILELDFEKQKLENLQSSEKDFMPREIADAAKELYASIQKDELLITILDEAIHVSKSEGGSIMMVDEAKKELVIRVSRGLQNKKNVLQARVKIGEGISGTAALENNPIFINGTSGEDHPRLRHLLKRPEIKRSIVIPLAVNGKVVGVLNLYTKSEEGGEQNTLPEINQLSSFIATALHSI